MIPPVPADAIYIISIRVHVVVAEPVQFAATIPPAHTAQSCRQL